MWQLSFSVNNQGEKIMETLSMMLNLELVLVIWELLTLL